MIIALSISMIVVSHLAAPEGVLIVYTEPEPVCDYDLLIKAVTWVESSHGVNVYNESEQAVGWFQIRQIRVDDYNKRIGNSYKLEDFYDYELSRKMFLYYAQKYDSWETIANRWSGSGHMTINYWNKVQTYLNSIP